MRVFVTGGTGFVGQAVLQRLMRAGHSIRILARNPHAHLVQRVVGQFGVEVHPGDVSRPESLEDGMKDCGAVIHLVGIISEMGESTFENIHTRGTQNVITAAKSAGGKRFVHMSALGTRPNAVSRYHKTKWAAEEIVRASGLDWTIFRPAIIYGPGDGFVNLFATIARFSPALPVFGSGENKLQPVPVESVAACFVNALTEPRSISMTFQLCARQPLTMREALRDILFVLGKRRWIIGIPLPLARLQAAFLEFVFPRLLRKPPPLNRDQLLMLQEDNVCDPRRAVEMFGVSLPLFHEGIGRYLRRDA